MQMSVKEEKNCNVIVVANFFSLFLLLFLVQFFCPRLCLSIVFIVNYVINLKIVKLTTTIAAPPAPQ